MQTTARTTRAEPEILSPGTGRDENRRGGKLFGGKLFDDAHLDLLSHVLDDFIPIPGTSIRFGLDGVLGVIPGIGDVLGGVASCIIIVAAWVRGVPTPVLTRMVANVAIEVVVGSVPVLGDMFDIAWRANRRNYALLTGSIYQPRKHTRQSWIFLAGLCVFLLALVLVPMLIVAWLAVHVLGGIFGMDIHMHPQP